MGDLIPRQCINLRMAFDRFATWGGEAPIIALSDLALTGAPHRSIGNEVRASIAEISGAMLDEFLQAFRLGELEALVRSPGTDADYAVPQAAWSEAFFPERLFLTDEVVAGHGGYFENLAERTPFVRIEDFDGWLARKTMMRSGSSARSSPAASAMLNLLHLLAFRGIASSAQVEEWAKRWGLPPLASEPSEEKFDPCLLPDWDLAMAVSWIVWRDKTHVRAAQADFASATSEWHECHYRVPEPDGEGFFKVHGEELKPPRKRTLFSLGLLDAIGVAPANPTGFTIADASAALWNACAEQTITASGIDPAGQVRQIPAHEWSRLKLASSNAGDDVLVWAHDILQTAYRSVTMPRTALLALWTPLVPESIAEGPTAKRAPKGGKFTDTVAAIRYLFPEGRPLGFSKKQMHRAVSEYLEGRGGAAVSFTTFTRALEHLGF